MPPLNVVSGLSSRASSSTSTAISLMRSGSCLWHTIQRPKNPDFRATRDPDRARRPASCIRYVPDLDDRHGMSEHGECRCRVGVLRQSCGSASSSRSRSADKPKIMPRGIDRETQSTANTLPKRRVTLSASMTASVVNSLLCLRNTRLTGPDNRASSSAELEALFRGRS